MGGERGSKTSEWGLPEKSSPQWCRVGGRGRSNPPPQGLFERRAPERGSAGNEGRTETLNRGGRNSTSGFGDPGYLAVVLSRATWKTILRSHQDPYLEAPPRPHSVVNSCWQDWQDVGQIIFGFCRSQHLPPSKSGLWVMKCTNKTGGRGLFQRK